MFNKFKKKKAFTIIELIVVIIVLGILTLIAVPKTINYVEKTKLARIQSDVKIMEQEIQIAMINDEININEMNSNTKNLGVLIMQNKMFEKEGIASRIDSSHLLINTEKLTQNNSELGVGGPLFMKLNSVDEKNDINQNEDDFNLDKSYKIIPEKYKNAIDTELKGTFYTNELGKVYYESEKPMKIKKENDLNCSNFSPDYDFDPITGTILKWNGTTTNLVIPEAFKATVNGEERCVPVRAIGKAAFMQGDFKSINLPEGLIIIKEDAFKENLLEEIVIPQGVEIIEKDSFAGNPFPQGSGYPVTVEKEKNKISISPGAFGSAGIVYKKKTANEMGIVFNPATGTIISAKPDKKVIHIPESFIINGIEYPVKKIDTGAYQGLGLISVTLPSSLERIEDYAFSGNQLEGINIPDKVNHIGHYAFAFNEATHNKTGHVKATINFINIKGKEQINKVESNGDIYENKIKVTKLDGQVNLLNQIFVTSIENHVIDEEYVGGKNEGGDEETSNKPVVFNGLSPEAFDRDLSTYSKVDGDLTWEGDLENREMILTTFVNTSNNGSSYGLYISFYNETGEELFPIGHNKRIVEPIRKVNTTKVVVPEGSTSIKLKASLGNAPEIKIYEVATTENLSLPSSIKTVNIEKTTNSVSLNWIKSKDHSKYAIYKNGEFLKYTSENNYEDKPLYDNKIYSYEIVPINEYGNAGSKKVVEVKTDKSEISFRGLTPAAFDNNLNTYSDVAGDVTWEGNLDNREISITTSSTSSKSHSSYGVYVNFFDKNNNDLGSTLHHVVGPLKTSNVIVPTGTAKMKFTMRGVSPEFKIYDVSIKK